MSSAPKRHEVVELPTSATWSFVLKDTSRPSPWWHLGVGSARALEPLPEMAATGLLPSARWRSLALAARADAGNRSLPLAGNFRLGC
jgi:hypothetical protein